MADPFNTPNAAELMARLRDKVPSAKAKKAAKAAARGDKEDEESDEEAAIEPTPVAGPY
jgi:hypothetical protein